SLVFYIWTLCNRTFARLRPAFWATQSRGFRISSLPCVTATKNSLTRVITHRFSLRRIHRFSFCSVKESALRFGGRTDGLLVKIAPTLPPSFLQLQINSPQTLCCGQ